MIKPVFCFDVESFGLYGIGYSVGIAFWDEDGVERRKPTWTAYYAVDRNVIPATLADRAWADANVPRSTPTHASLAAMRTAFWHALQYMKTLGADIVVDCGCPVEANFLTACVLDDPQTRTWEAPYPLHELATLLMLKGLDPIGTYDRLPEELPKHNPLCDAIQTGRLWIENR